MREPPAMQAVIAPCPLENQMQGPLTEELAKIAPGRVRGRIQLSGVVNALDAPDFAAAVQATGRRNLIIAGVTNDVCTVHPTLTALRQGYRVHAVADAGGSMSRLADDVALRRMESGGATLTSTNMILHRARRQLGLTRRPRRCSRSSVR